MAAVSGGGLSHALELQGEPLVELRNQALAIAVVAVEGGTEQRLVPWADALSKESRLSLLLDLLLSLLRDIVASRSGGEPLHRDLAAEIDSLSERAPLTAWLDAYSLAEEAIVDLRDRYLNKRITLSRLLVSLRALSA